MYPFLVLIMLTPNLFLDLTLGQNSSSYNSLNETLKCWECKGSASPLCDENHEGESLPCPGSDSRVSYGTFPDDSYVCMIMMTVSKATGVIEITKGCSLDASFFIVEKPQHDFLKSLQPGDCYVHAENIFRREVYHHKVKICICDTDNCNKYTINGTGREDIAARNAKKKSEAVAATPPQHLILILMLITNQVIRKK